MMTVSLLDVLTFLVGVASLLSSGLAVVALAQTLRQPFTHRAYRVATLAGILLLLIICGISSVVLLWSFLLS